MWYISPVTNDEADGILRDRYDQDLKENGYVPNTTRAWSYRPDLMTQWLQLIRGIRSHMRMRVYELVTLATSRAIGCIY